MTASFPWFTSTVGQRRLDWLHSNVSVGVEDSVRDALGETISMALFVVKRHAWEGSASFSSIEST